MTSKLKNKVDSQEYEILINATRQIAHLSGLTCEIGVREGGSSYMIMNTLLTENKDYRGVHIGIDPFGDIDYAHGTLGNIQVDKCGYTNQMKRQMLRELYEWCDENSMEFLFFPLEDTEFFKRYADGVPIYKNEKKIINTYKLVFFDGPHTFESIKEEISFFEDRMGLGSAMVFDDISQYRHYEKIHPYLLELGFNEVEKGYYKISYIRRDFGIGGFVR